jgi:ribonucleotide reductase alpha subunit
VLFEKLYTKYENQKNIKKKVLPAVEIFKNGILKERTDTGRIYMVNIDNVINQGPFDTLVNPIYQSNLCLTGDTTIQIMDTNKTIHSISLEDFVNRFDADYMSNIKVRSSNILTGEVTWNIVSNAAKTATVTELIEIEDESGKIIRCTLDHQIYTKNRGYIRAGDLVETDELCVEI